MADMNMYIANTWLAYRLRGYKSIEMMFRELGLGNSQLVRGSPFLVRGTAILWDLLPLLQCDMITLPVLIIAFLHC